MALPFEQGIYFLAMTSNQPTNRPPAWPLLPSKLEFPEENPFAQDRLSRKEEAERLTVLLAHCPTPLVLGLDAAWGTGKTTFVSMWRRHLKNKGFKTIYFNAWETDFINEPLVALVGEIGCLLPPKSRIAKKLTSATGLLLKKATPIAIRLLTAGLIDIKSDDLRLDPEKIEEALTDSAEKIVEEAIEQYQRHKDEVAEFRNVLEQAVESAAADGKPLVFFVDELDRCRPTFAVELLERIKHLFEVPGVVFVLSVHREQLAHSVKAIYGHDFDAEGYLSRFFHLSYRLLDPTPGEYAKFLFNQAGFSLGTPGTECLLFLMDYLGFSLRKQQRCVTRFALVWRLIGQGNRHDDPDLYAALLAFREWQPKLYEQFLVGLTTADALIDALASVNHSGWEGTRETIDIEIGILGLDFDRQLVMRRDMTTQWISSRLEFHRALAEKGNERSNRIIENLQHHRVHSYGHEHQWRRVLKLLELGGQFQIQEANSQAI